MSSKKITVALAGNPNSGKTTIFNALTGARQHVGNYSGVTVEKKEGIRNYKGYEINFVDLPGTYSLAANSVEEVVARDFVILEKPDVVVNVIDAGNFERNLYLSTQIMELNVPLVLALNMADIAEKQGFAFDRKKIGQFFNSAEVVLTVGSKGTGLNDLLDAVIKKSQEGIPEIAAGGVNYGEDIEKELSMLANAVDAEHILAERYGNRWLALKMLEQDQDIMSKGHKPEVLAAVDDSIARLDRLFGDRPEVIIAEKRYGFISGIFNQCVTHTAQRHHDMSDTIDKVLLNRILGLPIFLVLMYITFKLVFWAGDPLMGYIESGFGWLSDTISGFWPAGSDSALRSLLVDGVIGGVGGVVVFLPNIVLLFLAISILEDSGYMARAAFIMDRVMKKIGLHGRSFIPMIIGFGCTVPAIMGTRILEDRKSRFTTILIMPFMSCGARLPIYALIIPAFFAPNWHGFILWLMYIIGVVVAVIAATVLRRTIFKGPSGIFLMELPPYRMPTMRGLMIHMWDRSWQYLKKAGTILLAISILLWALASYPKPTEEMLAGLDSEQAVQVELQYSIAGHLGKIMEPVIKPLGFDYRIGTALIGALAAKEVFVAQMGIVYSVGEADEESTPLREKLRDNYTPLQGLCIMLFC
ncbi:MAG: ferrous iron transport protein B, partial [Sedimentisphaerales bacterium]|nr:ferrous iron transport protein B [Sedimentisphaerales bacterium]